MEAQKIWNDYLNNKVDVKMISDKIYRKIMKNIKHKIINFQEIYEDNFYVSNYIEQENYQEYVSDIVSDLKEKLNKDKYISDIETEDEKITVKIYLLEKTESQCKIIEEKTKEFNDESVWEFCLDGNFGICIWMITVLIISSVLYVIHTFSPNTIIAFIGYILTIFLLFGTVIFIEFKKQDVLREKGYKAKEIEQFIQSQQRIFCTEHSDKNKIEKLYNSYTYNSDWKNYLPYAKEKESFWKRLKEL